METEESSSIENSIDRDEEDDPVVSEMPVYLAKSLDCYLLQYPTRPASMTYDNAIVQKTLFRPKNQQIEMHLALNTTNTNYDRSRGEQIALNVDGQRSSGATNNTFSSDVMDVQVLSGGKAASDTTRYAVGIVNNGELHLTQVKGALTVRPNLSYLDKSDKRAKAEGRSADPDDPGSENEAKPEAITVKFSKGENDRSAKWKEKSYQTKVKREDEEPWVDMQFSQVKSVRWDDESQNLFCDNMDNKIQLDQTPLDFLQSIR